MPVTLFLSLPLPSGLEEEGGRHKVVEWSIRVVRDPQDQEGTRNRSVVSKRLIGERIQEQVGCDTETDGSKRDGRADDALTHHYQCRGRNRDCGMWLIEQHNTPSSITITAATCQGRNRDRVGWSGVWSNQKAAVVGDEDGIDSETTPLPATATATAT
eukprot:CAMPEP_0171037892 /NCGR_PEP_ID=MMETSP0736-20130129/42702_1 /TAXON_ID=186038 /ORGANISM="Fragilariopsis kerguelensis, Strain L26-C5" /LENGTH=157 /DNA_ID=CAMNT_0011483813 /DNA_START=199 /DNA_END=669 /DNA_ORIENTATION=+